MNICRDPLIFISFSFRSTLIEVIPSEGTPERVALLLHGDEDQDALLGPSVESQCLDQGSILLVGGVQHPDLLHISR